MSIEENLRLAREYISASNEMEWDRFAEFFADETVGADYAEFERKMWSPAFPDTFWDVTSITAQEDRVVIEGNVQMTHAGTLEFWVKESAPATNKKVEFGLCVVQEWKDGKIAHFRNYMNPASVLTQLGIAENIAWETT